MFSGIGGFEIGIERALPRAHCVGYSEIDAHADAVYRYHFQEHQSYGDATDLDHHRLPDFELLVAGFPCQAFSVSGARRGFADARGTLFFEIVRVLAGKRPGHLVLENVTGLLSHDEGKTFQTVLGILADLGYRVEWQILNSQDFDVCQRRERIYLVGHLAERCSRAVLPVCNRQRPPAATGRHASPAAHRFIATRRLGRNGRLTSPQCFTLQATEIPGVIEHCRMGGADHRWQERARSAAANPPTGEASFGHPAARIRRLTPVECERLQGFPDDWTRLGADGQQVSDYQRYRLCGNAVTTSVVAAVASALGRCLT